jgi:hypothetical protein
MHALVGKHVLPVAAAAASHSIPPFPCGSQTQQRDSVAQQQSSFEQRHTMRHRHQRIVLRPAPHHHMPLRGRCAVPVRAALCGWRQVQLPRHRGDVGDADGHRQVGTGWKVNALV